MQTCTSKCERKTPPVVSRPASATSFWLRRSITNPLVCVDEGKPVRVMCTFMSMRTTTRSCVACAHTVTCVIHGLSLTVSLILTHHTLGTYHARVIH